MSVTPLDTKLKTRLVVLNDAYDVSDGSKGVMLDSISAALRLGIPAERVHAAVEYLSSEGLLKIRGWSPGVYYTIEHAGAVEVEEARLNPTRGTAHFPQNITVQMFHGPVASVQTGAGSMAHVTQTSGFDAHDLVRVIASIREATPADRAELGQTIDDLEEELKAPQPKPSKIHAYLARAQHLASDIALLKPLLTELAKALRS